MGGGKSKVGAVWFIFSEIPLIFGGWGDPKLGSLLTFLDWLHQQMLEIALICTDLTANRLSCLGGGGKALGSLLTFFRLASPTNARIRLHLY